MSEWMIQFFFFAAGFTVGWLLYRKPPVIRDAKIDAKLVIDQDFVNKMDAETMTVWLEQRGLTWQPKGAVFDPDRKFDK